MFGLHVCVPGAQEGQKRVSGALELELQMTVNHLVGAGAEPGSSA